MASLRKRANGNYSLVFWWKRKQHIKALGTPDEQEANQIKEDAEEQLDRIRRGKSALASKLLADASQLIELLDSLPITRGLECKHILDAQPPVCSGLGVWEPPIVEESHQVLARDVQEIGRLLRGELLADWYD